MCLVIHSFKFVVFHPKFTNVLIKFAFSIQLHLHKIYILQHFPHEPFKFSFTLQIYVIVRKTPTLYRPKITAH